MRSFKKMGVPYIASFLLLVTAAEQPLLATGEAGIFLPPAASIMEKTALPLLPPLPRKWGKVQKIFKGQSPFFLIHIQDAHLNIEAQENIARMIHFFTVQTGMSRVYLEGASGELSHRPFSLYPDAKARKLVAQAFLNSGMLSGPEFTAMVKHPELTLVGVEDAGLYEKNRRAFLQALKYQERHASFFQQLRRRTEALGRLMLSPDLYRLLKERQNFHQEQTGLPGYAGLLASLKQKAAVSVETPQLDKLTALLKLKNVKGKAAEKAAEGLSLSLFDEIQKLESVLKKAMVRKPEEEKLLRIYEVLDILEHMTTFALTHEEAAAYYERPEDFEMPRLLEDLRVLSRQYRFSHDFDMETSANFQKDLREFQNFYELALERDEALTRNTLEDMENQGARFAVLVTGGFHTPKLEEILEKKGISYCVLTPRMTEIDQARDKERYIKAMRAEHTPFFQKLQEIVRHRRAIARDPRFQLQPPRRLPTLDLLQSLNLEAGSPVPLPVLVARFPALDFMVQSLVYLSAKGIQNGAVTENEILSLQSLKPEERILPSEIFPLLHGPSTLIVERKGSGAALTNFSSRHGFAMRLDWGPEKKSAERPTGAKEMFVTTPDGITTRVELLRDPAQYESVRAQFRRAGAKPLARSENRTDASVKPWHFTMNTSEHQDGDIAVLKKALSQPEIAGQIRQRFTAAGGVLPENSPLPFRVRAHSVLADGTKVAKPAPGQQEAARIYKLVLETPQGRIHFILKVTDKMQFRAYSDDLNQLENLLLSAKKADGTKASARDILGDMPPYSTVYVKKVETKASLKKFELRPEQKPKAVALLEIHDTPPAAITNGEVRYTGEWGAFKKIFDIHSLVPKQEILNAPEPARPPVKREIDDQRRRLDDFDESAFDKKATATREESALEDSDEMVENSFLEELSEGLSGIIEIATQEGPITEEDSAKAKKLLAKMESAVRSESRSLSEAVEKQKKEIESGREQVHVAQLLLEIIEFRRNTIPGSFKIFKSKASLLTKEIAKAEGLEAIDELSNGRSDEVNEEALGVEKKVKEEIEKLEAKTVGNGFAGGQYSETFQKALASARNQFDQEISKAAKVIENLGVAIGEKYVTLSSEILKAQQHVPFPASVFSSDASPEGLSQAIQDRALKEWYEALTEQEKKKLASVIPSQIEERLLQIQEEIRTEGKDNFGKKSVWQEEVKELKEVYDQVKRLPAENQLPEKTKPIRPDFLGLITTGLIFSGLYFFLHLSLTSIVAALFIYRLGDFVAKHQNEIGHVLAAAFLKEKGTWTWDNLTGNKSLLDWLLEFFLFVQIGASPQVHLPALKERMEQIESRIESSEAPSGLLKKQRKLLYEDKIIRYGGWFLGALVTAAFMVAVYGILLAFVPYMNPISPILLMTAFASGGLTGIAAAFYSDFFGQKDFGCYQCGNLYIVGKGSIEELLKLAETRAELLFLRGAQEIGIQVTIEEQKPRWSFWSFLRSKKIEPQAKQIKVVRVKKFIAKRADAVKYIFAALRKELKNQKFPSVVKIKIHSRWATTGDAGENTIEMMANTAHPHAGEPGSIQKILSINDRDQYEFKERYVENTFAFNGDIDGLDFSREDLDGDLEGIEWLKGLKMDLDQIRAWLNADLDLDPATIPDGDAPDGAKLVNWLFAQGQLYKALRIGYRFGVAKSFEEPLPKGELQRLEKIISEHIDQKIAEGKWTPQGAAELSSVKVETLLEIETELIDLLIRDPQLKFDEEAVHRFVHQTVKAYFRNDLKKAIFWIKRFFFGTISAQFDTTLKPDVKYLLTWGQPLSQAFGDKKIFTGASDRKVLQGKDGAFRYRFDMNDSEAEVTIQGYDHAAGKPYIQIFTGPHNRPVTLEEILAENRIKDMTDPEVVDPVPARDEEFKKNPVEAEMRRMPQVLGEIARSWKKEIPEGVKREARLIVQQRIYKDILASLEVNRNKIDEKTEQAIWEKAEQLVGVKENLKEQIAAAAAHFTGLLKDRPVLENPARDKSGDYDVVIVGTEKSEYAGKEHAFLLEILFKGLGFKPLVLSSQEVIKYADRYRKNPEEFKEKLNINDRTFAIQVAASGGQTQDIKIATDWLSRVLPEGFSDTGGKDNLMVDPLGKGRNINTFSGANRDELNLVAYAAQNLTFAYEELALARDVLNLLPENYAKNLPAREELDLFDQELAELSHHSIKNILGYDADGNAVQSIDSRLAKRQGSQFASYVLDRAKGWFGGAFYLAISLATAVSFFVGLVLLVPALGIQVPVWLSAAALVPDYVIYLFLSSPGIPYLLRLYRRWKFNEKGNFFARIGRSFLLLDDKEYVWRFAALTQRKMAANSYGLTDYTLEGVSTENAPDERAFNANRGSVVIIGRPDGRVPLSWADEDLAIRVAKFVKTIMPPPKWLSWPIIRTLVKKLKIKPVGPEVITFGQNPAEDKKSANVHLAYNSKRTLTVPGKKLDEKTYPILQELYLSRVDAFQRLLFFMRLQTIWGVDAASFKPLSHDPSRTPSTAAYKTTQVRAIGRILEAITTMPVLIKKLVVAEPKRVTAQELNFRVLAPGEPLPSYHPEEEEITTSPRPRRRLPLPQRKRTQRHVPQVPVPARVSLDDLFANLEHQLNGHEDSAVLAGSKTSRSSSKRSEMRQAPEGLLPALRAKTQLEQSVLLEREIPFEVLEAQAEKEGWGFVSALENFTAETSYSEWLRAGQSNTGEVIFVVRPADHDAASLKKFFRHLKNQERVRRITFIRDVEVSETDWQAFKSQAGKLVFGTQLKGTFIDGAGSEVLHLAVMARMRALGLSWQQVVQLPYGTPRAEYRKYYDAMMIGAVPLANSTLLVLGNRDSMEQARVLRAHDIVEAILNLHAHQAVQSAA